MTVDNRKLFHSAHYNKIAALLGRNIAKTAKTVTDPEHQFDIYEDIVAIGIAGDFVVMFQKDNENFSEDAFLNMIIKHAMIARGFSV